MATDFSQVTKFTKQDAARAEQAALRLFNAIPRDQWGKHYGDFRKVCKFIEAANAAAPADGDGEADGEEPAPATPRHRRCRYGSKL